MTMCRWDHSRISLENFLNHVKDFVHVLNLIDSPALSKFEGPTIKKASSWGIYIENVVLNLSEKQEEILQSTIDKLYQCSRESYISLKLLKNAHREILSRVLNSYYLPCHPRVDLLIRTVMDLYVGPNLLCSKPTPSEAPMRIVYFVEDLCATMKRRANIANYSDHLYTLSLLSSKADGARDSAISYVQHKAYAKLLCELIYKQSVEGKNWNKTLQDIEESARLDGQEGRDALQVLALMLLQIDTIFEISENCTKIHSQNVKDAIISGVMQFRDDNRLWKLDKYILTELSELYLPIAHAYVVHLFSMHRQCFPEVLIPVLQQSNSQTGYELIERINELKSRSVRLYKLVDIMLETRFDT